MAMNTGRHCLRARKNTAKKAGVSLMAAARPMSAPRGHRVRASRQSAMTSTPSNRLTCPNHNVSRSGSKTETTAATPSPYWIARGFQSAGPHGRGQAERGQRAEVQHHHGEDGCGAAGPARAR